MIGRKITPRLQSMQRATSRITGGPGRPAAPGRGNLASSLGAGNAAKRVAAMAQAMPKKDGGMMNKMKMVMKGGKKVPAFAADGIGKMKKGGAAGMHKMPDGTMMKDSDMAKMGRAVKRKTADVKGRAMKKGK